VIHLGVTPQHFAEAFAFGAVMLIVGLGQLISSGLRIVRPSRRLVLGMIVGNALVIVVYIIAYTVGLPFGPDAGKAGEVNTIASLATLSEIGLLLPLVVLLAAVLRGGFHRRVAG
jgi:hypothetical protein